MWMVDKNRSEAETDTRLREKSGQTEKITINVGFVDLGHIDSLVHEGLLLQSHRLRQDGDPQPACRSRGGHQAIDRPACP